MLNKLPSARVCVLFASVFTFFFAATVPAAAHDDIFRRTSLNAVVHWKESTVRMGIDPELEARFGAGVRGMLEEASAAWDLGGDVPTFELDHDVTDEDRESAFAEATNWIGFADEWTYGDKLAVTVSTFDAASGALISAQVWINPDRKFEIMPEDTEGRVMDSYDLHAVLTHELGHVLGLGEADDAPDATMFPTFHRGETRQRTLSLTDEEAVGELYAQARSNDLNEPSAQCAVTMPGANHATVWPLAAFAFAGLLTTRRLFRYLA